MNQTPTPQERANTAEVAEVLRRLHAIHAEHYNTAYPATLCALCKHQADMLAAASLLRQAPPQVAGEPGCGICGGSGIAQEEHDGGWHPVHCPCTNRPAGEDVERVARAVADAQNVPFPGPKQRKIALAALAALSARPVEAQEVKRLRRVGNGRCGRGSSRRLPCSTGKSTGLDRPRST